MAQYTTAIIDRIKTEKCYALLHALQAVPFKYHGQVISDAVPFLMDLLQRFFFFSITCNLIFF